MEDLMSEVWGKHNSLQKDYQGGPYGLAAPAAAALVVPGSDV
jgi:hypothetical protein